MIMISKFRFKLTVFIAKLLTSGILFSTAVDTFFVAKLLTSGFFFSNSLSFNKISLHQKFFSNSVLSA